MQRLIPYPSSLKEKNDLCQTAKVEKRTCDTLAQEEYRITVTSDETIIEASSDAGFFYASKTLEQLEIFYPSAIPCLEIKDAPLYSYRGFMLDSVRHFISVNELKKIIDIAAEFKFNKFHWHLSDDQGFRIELETFPELTSKGSIRPGDSYRLLPKTGTPYGGYYTKREIKEIVDFCKERFIEVIPEIDMPGHTSAILYTYSQYHCNGVSVEIKTKEGIFKDILCAGKQETYDFLYKLLDEITELFPGEYFHIGGDEAPKAHWEQCPDCKRKMQELNISSANDLQVWFGNTIAEYLKSKGKKVIMWNDILKGKGLDEDVILQKWMDIKNLTLPETNKGRKTIASDFRPYYADYPYGMFPLKDVFKFVPKNTKGLTLKGQNSIVGIESPLWTEFVNTEERLEYLIFPRWFAVADTAWGGYKKDDYKEFRQATAVLCEKLKENGINPAPKKDWDMNPARRLGQTVNFFLPKTK